MISTSRFLSASILSCLAFCASADAVLVDPDNRASLEITSAPSPVAGFTTYSFSVSPIQPSTEISSIDATFQAAVMRQVNPDPFLTGPLSTIFQDNNGAIGFVGEDVDGDSQFEFLRTGVTVVPSSDVESSTELSAAFTSFAPITSDQTIAHVVLPNGDTGTLDLDLAVRPLGGGTALFAVFANVPFGGAVVIPEPSQIFAFSLLAFGALGRRSRSMRVE